MSLGNSNFEGLKIVNRVGGTNLSRTEAQNKVNMPETPGQNNPNFEKNLLDLLGITTLSNNGTDEKNKPN